eukprot:m.187068 g.187068  ORF g.187068 m.187068 type:complete len:1148 (-) comp32293_c1_seq3:304-3747(-)
MFHTFTTLISTVILGLSIQHITALPIPRTQTTTDWNAHHIIRGITFHNLEAFYHESKDGIDGDGDSYMYTDNRRRSDFIIQSLLDDSTPESAIYGDWILLTDGIDISRAICLAAANNCIFIYEHVMNGVAVNGTLPQILDLVYPFEVDIVGVEAAVQMHTIDTIVGQSQPPWGLDRIDQPNLPLDANFNHPQNGGNGTKVFVIDTGIRCSHVEFAGGRCERGFSIETPGYVCQQGDDTCADDGHSHGTHCAGTIAGTQSGVAKAATVVAVKVLTDSGSGGTHGVIAGIDWVYTQKIASTDTPMVASISLGGGYSASLNNAVENLRSAGVAVSVAAGNYNQDACRMSPASSDAAITVGSVGSNDVRSYFSNYGSCVNIFAPGEGVVSASNADDTSFRSKTGTSMSCPHVAGVLAQIFGTAASNLTPLTVAQAEAILVNSAIPNVVGDTVGSPNLLLNNAISGASYTLSPTQTETSAPTGSPPTPPPTQAPFPSPTTLPTTFPSATPTTLLTSQPSLAPTSPQTTSPTQTPTTLPTSFPSATPTSTPSRAPIFRASPTHAPFHSPTTLPTSFPSTTPTTLPTSQPSRAPTLQQTVSPTQTPFPSPTTLPTSFPSQTPTMLPTSNPVPSPTPIPTSNPSDPHTAHPTIPPTMQPTRTPTLDVATPPPTSHPSHLSQSPTSPPTAAPTAAPATDIHQGRLCVNHPVSGNTQHPGVNTRGNSAPDHTYAVVVDHTDSYTFTTCGDGTAFDTFIRLYDGTKQIASNDDACGLQSTIELELAPGTYTLLIEGYSINQGTYTMTMSSATSVTNSQVLCEPVHQTSTPTPRPTALPTFLPTSLPTLFPTPAPTPTSPTSTPTSSPTRAQTSTPTPSPTSTPTPGPTQSPTPSPTSITSIPTLAPTPTPTAAPIPTPIPAPTLRPTPSPTLLPTPTPTQTPTPNPTPSPALGDSTGPIVKYRAVVDGRFRCADDNGGDLIEITSSAECEQAAVYLGLATVHVHALTRSKRPNGCFYDYPKTEIGVLELNTEGNWDQVVDVEENEKRPSLCRVVPSTTTSTITPSLCYEQLATTGETCSSISLEITTQEECEMAAEMLGLKDTTATVNAGDSRTQKPINCYFDTARDILQFNPDGARNIIDTRRQNICRCENSEDVAS